ncbi:MAG: hypothetical protein HQK92_07640 [Nitrospirae bacterium]|nr:hypothetical protein [Nitrospirota bacterium]
MPEVNLFLLLAETTKVNQWMLSNDPTQDESSTKKLLQELFNYITEVETEMKIENYIGYYDKKM